MAFKMKGYSAFTKTDPPNEDVVRKEDKYPKGKSRWWKNLKYKITKNPKHLKK